MEELRRGGYPVKDAVEALGISRSWYYSALRGKGVEFKQSGSKEEELLGRIKVLKGDHPF